MPNWCQNLLIVRGSESDVAGFIDAAMDRKSMLSFEKLRPMPESEEQQMEESAGGLIEQLESSMPGGYKNPGWYHWRVANWGTKWPTDNVQLERDDPETASYSFDTAWSPPEELVEFIGKKFPKLRFELQYYEGGCDFAGILEMRNGQKYRQVNGTCHEMEPQLSNCFG